jgi:hypothetical protein
MIEKERGEQNVTKREDTSKSSGRNIVETEGGAYVGGNVNVGGGDFIGRDKVRVGHVVQGDEVRGDKITVGDIAGSTGIAIGRGAKATVTSGPAVGSQDLDRLFTPLMDALRNAPSEKRHEALQMAEALKEEVAKGKNANDDRMATLLDGLVERVPAVVSPVVNMFATQVLAGIAGPVTTYVLKRMQRQ